MLCRSYIPWTVYNVHFKHADTEHALGGMGVLLQLQAGTIPIALHCFKTAACHAVYVIAQGRRVAYDRQADYAKAPKGLSECWEVNFQSMCHSSLS